MLTCLLRWIRLSALHKSIDSAYPHVSEHNATVCTSNCALNLLAKLCCILTQPNRLGKLFVAYNRNIMNTRMDPRAVSSHDMHIFDSLHLHEQGEHRSKVVPKEKLLLPHCLTHAMYLSLPLAPAKPYARIAKFMLLHSHSILLTHAVFGSHCLLTQFLPNWFALPTHAVFAKCNKSWFTLLTHAVFANGAFHSASASARSAFHRAASAQSIANPAYARKESERWRPQARTTANPRRSTQGSGPQRGAKQKSRKKTKATMT